MKVAIAVYFAYCWNSRRQSTSADIERSRMTMNDAVAIVSGAIISGIVGVLVVFFQQRLARQHDLDTAKALRLSEFSAAGWAATLAIGELARVPLAQKDDIENTVRFQAVTDRFNSALAQIQLLDDGDVYAAAHRVDACLVDLIHYGRSTEADRHSWRAKQQEGLSDAVAAYQRAARRSLGSSSLPGPEPWLVRAQQSASWYSGSPSDTTTT
jgi:hypothetical protein